MKREILQIISLVEREITVTKKVIGDFFPVEEGEGFYVSFKKEVTKLSITIFNHQYDYVEITKETKGLKSPQVFINYKARNCSFC